MSELMKTVPILRFGGGAVCGDLGDGAPTEDQVIREWDFSLQLNGTLIEVISCIPDDMEELALGHLLTEGFISSPGEVTALHVDQVAGSIEVTGDPKPPVTLPRLFPIPWIPEDVMSTAGRFLEKSSLFEATGMVHSALITVAQAEYCCQCIGRHNAINKAVGLALKAGAALSQATLYTSGRLPVSMALKAVRAGIPMVVSRSGPTDATLSLAQRTGLTVVGFARANRMNLYTPL